MGSSFLSTLHEARNKRAKSQFVSGSFDMPFVVSILREVFANKLSLLGVQRPLAICLRLTEVYPIVSVCGDYLAQIDSPGYRQRYSIQ